MSAEEKHFSIGMVVSCKRSDCQAEAGVCAHCVQGFIGENVKKHTHFSLSEATTGNQSKQFVVSFIAHCAKPDCTGSPEEFVGSCCTASSDKCEMCLRTIVSRGIREMYGFHAKEIVVA